MSDISSKTAPRSRFSVREICYSGLFAAVIAIMAQISIPMPGGVPMTKQTFAGAPPTVMHSAAHMYSH